MNHFFATFNEDTAETQQDSKATTPNYVIGAGRRGDNSTSPTTTSTSRTRSGLVARLPSLRRKSDLSLREQSRTLLLLSPKSSGTNNSTTTMLINVKVWRICVLIIFLLLTVVIIQITLLGVVRQHQSESTFNSMSTPASIAEHLRLASNFFKPTILSMRKERATTTSDVTSSTITNDSSNNSTSANITPKTSDNSYRDKFHFCIPKTKLIFVKTHKTGSTTIQNIIFRYGWIHNWKFAVPQYGNEYTVRKLFQADFAFNSKGLEAKKSHSDFDLFAFHSVYNHPELMKVVPGAPFVTILRDPVECFESVFVYMELRSMYKMDINQFAYKLASKGVKRDSKRSEFGKNQMLYMLGMNASSMETRKMVEEKIADLDKELSLVMIKESFDEGLILFKDLMCWSLQDIVYMKKNYRSLDQVSNITSEARMILKKWLWADDMLYHHFRAKFYAKVNEYGREKLRNEVAQIRHLNDVLFKKCVFDVNHGMKLGLAYRETSPVVLGYAVNESLPICSLVAVTETHFINKIRTKQKLKAVKNKSQYC